MELLSHMGYHGSIETSLADKVLHGKILFIDDLVTYEAENISQLEVEFIAAVEDYLETCTNIGKPAQKACSGQFNVRIPPDLHRLAQLRAAQDATNLNAVTTRALETYLKDRTQTTIGTIYVEAEPAYAAGSNITIFHESRPATASKEGALCEATNAGSSSVITLIGSRPKDNEYAH